MGCATTLAGSIALTIGPVLAAFAVLTILHSGNPAKHAPAGGSIRAGATRPASATAAC
jgi:hypothetical protein